MTLFRGVAYEYSAGAGGLLFTAGACPLNAEGKVVGIDDLEAQAAAATDNLLEALHEAGSGAQSLVKTTIYVVGRDRDDLVRVWQVVSARLGRTPSTLLGVSLLGYPDQLVEIEAIASLTPATESATGR
ncbi:MAG TPA: RidA family protein [Thermomicrobiaceae bacterium]|nr:RidA family protein [Thermomicrobiaceae bacterium]